MARSSHAGASAWTRASGNSVHWRRSRRHGVTDRGAQVTAVRVDQGAGGAEEEGVVVDAVVDEPGVPQPVVGEPERHRCTPTIADVRPSTILFAGLLVVAIACRDADEEPVATIVSDASPGDWQQLVDDVAASSPGVPGVALAVLGDGVDVAVAAGSGGPELDDPLTPERPFRIASNTKTFTAAATLRLVEEGAIRLDQPIAELVDPALLELLTDDGYDTEAITVAHLLQHTSGLYDYASDVDFQTIVLGDPERHWTRADQVLMAMEGGDPLGEPGEVFAYSDTGYVLLGDIIERATGDTLAAAFRELLRFDELGLRLDVAGGHRARSGWRAADGQPVLRDPGHGRRRPVVRSVRRRRAGVDGR